MAALTMWELVINRWPVTDATGPPGGAVRQAGNMMASVGFAGDGMGGASDNAMHQHRHDAGQYRRIELITGVSRRRRWTPAEKAALVAESLRPGVNVSDLARRSGVNRGLLQTWRRAALQEMEHGHETFVPIRVEDAAPIRQVGPLATATVEPSGATTLPSVIELEGCGMRVRFSGPVDAGALRLVLGHFGRRA